MSLTDYEKRKARDEAFNEGFEAGAHAALTSPEVLALVEALDILIDDAEFFTGDVRKMSAWPRILNALAAFKAAFGQGEQ